MKKICFITTVHGTLRSFVLPTVRFLLEETDWDITLVCNYNKEFERTLPENVHFHPIAMERGISISGIKAMLEMTAFFRKEKFDLIQYSTPNASFYAALAGKMARVPVRLYCQWGIAYVGFSGIKRRIFKLIEKTICRLSTWIEPDSTGNLLFSHAEGLYPQTKGSVIWNGSASGVNLDKFDYEQKNSWRENIRRKYEIPESSIVLLFIGRITGDKGINELFEAVKRIMNQRNDVFLFLVGNIEKEESIADYNLLWAKNHENVIFCGYSYSVEKYIAASDIYVLPSYREGFGSAVVEAEAMGTPVIVTDIPGPTDAMIKNVTGLTVQMKNAEDLYTALNTLIDDSELRRSLGNNGREYAVRNFEQKELCRHILEDRKRLLGIN